MNYLNYTAADCVNGVGFRVVLWLSFCSHGCKNCFNESSWNGGGTEVTEGFTSKILSDLDKPHIKGITFSGGDPLHKRNYQEVISLCRRIKRELPDKDIWLYSGYTYQEIKNDLLRSPILETIDYLMDGKYEHDKPTTKPFRGSDNQILHTLSKGISIKQS